MLHGDLDVEVFNKHIAINDPTREALTKGEHFQFHRKQAPAI